VLGDVGVARGQDDEDLVVDLEGVEDRTDLRHQQR
jgi:hypothetical protein